MSDPILVERSDAIATIYLNRPEKLNALSRAMWRMLGDRVSELSADETVRCIVVRGAGGKAFSPGNDISLFEQERSTADQARDYAKDLRHTVAAFRACRHPTVALIEGICVGGGLEIAALCDIRICNASSRFGVPIKRLGLVMAHGEIEILRGLVGPAVALEILLEGRIMGADEARDKGLVHRVEPDDKAEASAYRTAARIAEGAPLVARWHKKFMRRLADPAPLTEAEVAEGYACFDTEDFQTGYRSFLDKTKPDFKGR